MINYEKIRKRLEKAIGERVNQTEAAKVYVFGIDDKIPEKKGLAVVVSVE